VALLALMIVWWGDRGDPDLRHRAAAAAGVAAGGRDHPAEAAAPYADPILFLFIAGFMIAVAIERWNLHARIALHIAARVGARPSALIGGFILAAALLSLWISNTATALMLTPIAMGVARELDAHGTATPPWARPGAGRGLRRLDRRHGHSGRLAHQSDRHGLSERARDHPLLRRVDDAGRARRRPAAPICWFLLTRDLRKGPAADPERGRTVLRTALAGLGPMSKAEGRVLAVFLAVAAAWMTRELLTRIPGLERLSDMGIAVMGALLLFLLPSGAGEGKPPRLLDWKAAERIPGASSSCSAAGCRSRAPWRARACRSGWPGRWADCAPSTPC
jgi:sodium-dependent dicarboxylate transporter 2/3/5